MFGSISTSSLVDTNLILERAGITERTRVADLGCGSTGHFVFPAAKLVGRKGMVYAVDILRTALETINKRAKLENLINIKTVWTNLEIYGATKIESGSLDVALLINTLYQSHKRAEIIRESVRLLKKNGRLVIVEWKSVAAPFGPPANERVKKEIIDLTAKKFGLKPDDEFEPGQYHYGLIYLKM